MIFNMPEQPKNQPDEYGFPGDLSGGEWQGEEVVLGEDQKPLKRSAKAQREAYKEAPGAYKEWAMTILNDVILKLQKEYPRLERLHHRYKYKWAQQLVLILVDMREGKDVLTQEELNNLKGKGEKFIEEMIRNFFARENRLDELKWEQEMDS